jgi:hypothetical protein
MTGSGLAAILIPIAGTIFLAMRLALVFHAGGHPGGPTTRRPAAKAPARPPWLTGASQAPLLRGAARTRHGSWAGADSGRPG